MYVIVLFILSNAYYYPNTTNNTITQSHNYSHTTHRYQKKAFYDEQDRRSGTGGRDGVVLPALERGEEVDATVVSYGPLGASVLLHKKGEAPAEKEGGEGEEGDREGDEEGEEEEEEVEDGQRDKERDEWDNEWSSGNVAPVSTSLRQREQEKGSVGRGLILQQEVTFWSAVRVFDCNDVVLRCVCYTRITNLH